MAVFDDGKSDLEHVAEALDDLSEAMIAALKMFAILAPHHTKAVQARAYLLPIAQDMHATFKPLIDASREARSK